MLEVTEWDWFMNVALEMHWLADGGRERGNG